MSKKTHNYTSVRRLTDAKFLNLYEMDAVAQSGAPFNYYFASRRRDENIRLNKGGTDPEGLCVYAVREDDPGQLLLLNQYRYPVDMYIYEVPAGLIDEGETPIQAAIREIREETGLIFKPYLGEADSQSESSSAKTDSEAESCSNKADSTADRLPYFSRPYVLAQGFSDEMGVNIYGTVSGDFSKDFQEDSERIDAFFVDRDEARRILREETVSMRAQLLLMQFIHADPKNPFEFLV